MHLIAPRYARFPARWFAVPLGTTLLLASAGAASAAVTFRVTVPASTPPGDIVYVAGDFQGWNPGSPAHALTRQPDGRWTISLALTPGQPIQFKFTRGSWETVEKGPNGEEIPNRTLTPQDGVTYDFTVARWRDDETPSTITGHVESFTHAPFLGGRRCWVYLPPGYAGSEARYPVLYMHDGQNLFDVRTSFAGEWQVDEACESLIPAGEIEPVIVVGIENAGVARCTEYTPWSYAGQPCPGGGGDAYLAAIRDLLIPEVDARYRTRPGRENRYLCGSSLGGLISAYAGYAYDDVFSRIAAVSPSYWWDGAHMIAFAQAHGRPDLDRFYQDMGTIESGAISDGNLNGIDDYIETLRAMRDVALAQGFTPGTDFLSVEADGHVHNEYFWSLRFPDLLRFLVGPPVTAVVLRPDVRGLRMSASPNPVDDQVRIEFTLERPSAVRIEILDLAGRRMATIRDGRFSAGRHAVRWSRRGSESQALTAGVYWVRLVADGAVASRRIVALR